jgi:hypothetical protein
MVLLKNENKILPLRSFRKILVAGDFINAAANFLAPGRWMMVEDVVPQQALKETAPKDVDHALLKIMIRHCSMDWIGCDRSATVNTPPFGENHNLVTYACLMVRLD